MVSSFEFQGKYQRRSSKLGARKIIGEKNILQINPGRVARLLEVTGWPDLYPGSLNLEVPIAVVTDLESLQELYFEHPQLIRYPEGLSNPAEKRGGYNYYWGKMTGSCDAQDILIRRAKVHPISNRVEAYAPIGLQEHFNLREGDTVTVTVRDA